ncbi:hypothetical protein FRC17_009937 [Serendipita sp. 399]|nr:hypothetical protein FRC17_009937 [Serendipita sp. 399]
MSCDAMQPELPPEIWAIIIDHVLYVPHVFDSTCEPAEFLFFKNSRAFHNAVNWPKINMNSDKVRMKQVCSTWRTLITSRYSTRWIDSRYDLSSAPAVRPKRADIEITGEGVLMLERLLAIPGATSQLSILSIKQDYSPTLHTVRLGAVFDRARDMSTIRSLTYDTTFNSVSSDTLGSLQRSFDSLKCLSIRAHRVGGLFHLPSLEILILDAESCELDQWWLPSLRHFSIDIRIDTATPYSSSQIPGPVQNIRSLMFLSAGKLMVLDKSFWEEHRSLEFLGTYASWLALIDVPPNNHPLAHLYSPIWITSDTSALPFINFVDLITQTGKLQTVGISNGRFPGKKIGDKWTVLLKKEGKRGVRFYDDAGVALDYMNLGE